MKKRTSRYYDGTSPTGKELSSLLGAFLSELKVESGSQKEEVFKAWSDIIGTKLAEIAIPISWDKGILTVKVKSSTLYSLFCTKEKGPLMQKLQKALPHVAIKNISFRVG